MTFNLAQFTDEMADDIRSSVAEIEARPQATRNHYGLYMTMLGRYPDPVKRGLLALSLVKAGANRQGVADALELIT